MEFVQNYTPPDFQAKNFTPPISPNFNSFSKKKHKKWVKMEKVTPLAKILHCRRHWRHGQIPPLMTRGLFFKEDFQHGGVRQDAWLNFATKHFTKIFKGAFLQDICKNRIWFPRSENPDIDIAAACNWTASAIGTKFLHTHSILLFFFGLW